jgi:PAS domain S-box-containing protein
VDRSPKPPADAQSPAVPPSALPHDNLLRAAPVGIGIVTPDRVIVDVNDELCRVTGYSREELVGRSTRMLYADEESFARGGTLHGPQASLTTTPWTEVRWRRRTGEPIVVRIGAGPVDRVDPTRSLAVLVLDVTDGKQLEESRQEQAEADTRFHNIVAASPMGVHMYSLEPDGRLVFRAANAAADRILGVNHRTLEGLSIEEAFPSLIDTEVPARYREVAAAGTSWMVPQVDYRDGRITGAFEVYAFQTTPGSMAVLFLDVTERLKSEEALRQKTEELDAFFSSAPDLLCIADLDGYFRRLNREWERTLGYTVEELAGRRFLDFVHPDDLEATDDAIRRLGAQHSVLGFTNRYRHRNGSYRWLEWRSFPAGRTVYAAARDMTDHRAMEEEQRRLQQQLEQAMKMEAIGRLAGGVAHDFNNLLTAILGNTDLALASVPRGHALEEPLREVDRAARSAASLTRQLLAFSRKQIVEPRVLDVNAELSRLHQMLVRLLGEDIALETIPGPGLGSVRVDAGQLEQVVVNLAVNARDAMPTGGRLVIETANVVLDDDYCTRHPHAPLGPCVRIAVSDSGHGMPPDVLARLFEPFFTTKSKERGTGLGLATTYGIVKQAGGSLEVYSEVDHGTSFKVYLPRVDEEAEQWAPFASQGDAPGGTETILLVEDEEQVRQLAVRVLRRLGYTVLAAGAGTHALAIAEGHDGPIHLLLTDVVMPGMSGRELANRLADRRPTVKVLYTSGYTENVIVHHGVLDAGIRFVSKPYTPRELAVAARGALDG